MFVRRKVLPIKPELSAKWPGQVLDEGFTPFPKRLLRCLDKVFVGPKAIDHLRVVLAVVDYARRDMTRLPSYEFLAFNAGMQIDEFRKCINEIRSMNWISLSGTEDATRIGIEGLARRIEELTPEE